MGFLIAMLNMQAHADQNRLLDTDINLSTVSYLSSDDELLIKCDENTYYMCVIPCHL